MKPKLTYQPATHLACLKTCDFLVTLLEAAEEFRHFFPEASSSVSECDWSGVSTVGDKSLFAKNSAIRDHPKDVDLLSETQLSELYVGLWLHRSSYESSQCDLYGIDSSSKEDYAKQQDVNCHFICCTVEGIGVNVNSLYPFCKEKKQVFPRSDKGKKLHGTLSYLVSHNPLTPFSPSSTLNSYNQLWWSLYKFRVAELYLTTIYGKLGEEHYAIITEENEFPSVPTQKVYIKMPDATCKNYCTLLKKYYDEVLPVFYQRNICRFNSGDTDSFPP